MGIGPMARVERRATVAFKDEVAARIEDEIDREFVEKGRAMGLDPVSMHDLKARYEEADLARDGEKPKSPLTNRDQRAASRMRHIGRRIEPPAEKPKEKPKPRRKQIMVQYDDIPIDLVDERNGETVTVFMRSIPTTELPYLDRHDMMLQRLRQKLATMTGRDSKTLRQVDALSREYNEISEEMTRFVVEMPEGLYENLNVPTLRALQREIQAMVTGSFVTSQNAEDDEDDDPNW
jgi:hypothetical protein